MENRSFALFFLRTLLGLLFFMQGFGKVFKYGVEGVYQSAFQSFEAGILPKWLLWSTAYFTSYVELIAGLLLILGLFRKEALYLLALVLLIVSFGHGLQQPIWDLSHVMPRSILLVSLLLLPSNWDYWHLDRILRKK